MTWCHVLGHKFVFFDDIAPQFQKTCLGYWRRLLSYFTLIGEVPAEKTASKQKRKYTNSMDG